MHSLLIALGIGSTAAATAAFAAGCEGDDSGGSSGGAFVAPDSGFNGETSSGGGPTGDGGQQGDGGEQADGATSEPTAPVALVNMASGTMRGAASADGSAIVISLAGPVINYSLYAPATGWTVGAAIPSITTTTTIRGSAAVAMDGKGNAFVTWTTTDGVGRNRFYVTRYDHATTTWGTALEPDSYAENFADSVAVVANASGDALASGVHHGATLAHDFVVQHYSASSGNWTEEAVAPFDNGVYTDLPDLHLTDSGKAVALMQGLAPAVRNANGTWTSAPAAPTGMSTYSAAVNEAGDAIVGYDLSNYAYAGRYDSATSMWIAPVQLSTEFTADNYNGCQAKVGIQPSGDGTYVRCFDGDVKRTIESYSYTKAANTWSPVTVVNEAGDAPGYVTFTFNSAGDGIAIYQDFVGINPPPSPAVINTFTAGVWSPQSAGLGGNNNTDTPPTAFLSPNGRGFAVWGEGANLHAKKVR